MTERDVNNKKQLEYGVSDKKELLKKKNRVNETGFLIIQAKMWWILTSAEQRWLKKSGLMNHETELFRNKLVLF